MRDHEMERYIRTAVEHAAPDKLDSILSSCGDVRSTSDTPISSQTEGGQMKGAVIKMSEKREEKPVWRLLPLWLPLLYFALEVIACLTAVRRRRWILW